MHDGIRRDIGDIARGAGAQYLGFVARLGARAPFLFLAGLLYGAERFGRFIFAVTIVETAAALALFGLKRSLFKFMSEATARREPVTGPVAHGVALAAVSASLVALVVQTSTWDLAAVFRTWDAATELGILTLSIPLIVLTDTFLTSIRFSRRMRYEVAARSIVEPIVLSAAAAGAFVAGARDLGLTLAYVVSLAAATGASLWSFTRVYALSDVLRARLHPGEMYRLLRFTGPTALYDLLLLLFARLDVLLVTYFLPTATVGVYGMALQFAGFAKRIKQGVDAVLTPVISQTMISMDVHRVRDQLTPVTRWMLTIELLPVLVFAFFGREILGLLGAPFAAGATVLTLLVLGEALNASFGTSELPLLYGHPARNIVAGVLTLVAGLAGHLLLIPSLGAPGAAVTVAGTYCLVNAYRITANRATFGIVTVNGAIVRPVAAGLVAALMAAATGVIPVEPLATVTRGLTVGVGYPLLAYSIALTASERMWLRSRLRRSSVRRVPGAYRVEERVEPHPESS